MILNWAVIAAGIAAGVSFPPLPFEFHAPAGFLVAGIVTLYLCPVKIKSHLLFLIAALYASAFLSVSAERFEHAGWRVPGKIMVFDGTVTSFPEKTPRGWKWEMKLQRLRSDETGWREMDGQAGIFARMDELPPLIGDRLILKGKVAFPKQTEPGAMRLRRNLFLRGLAAQIWIDKPGDFIYSGWEKLSFPARLIQLLRESLAVKIERQYSGTQAGIMQALLLGMRVPDSVTRKVFTDTGTLHLLSVSGFHTAVIAAIAFGIAILCRSRPEHAVIWAGTGTLIYMLMTGWGIAVQRAGFMAILTWAAWAWGRPRDALHWLTAMMSVLLVCDPRNFFSISFQLSFLSMYGILLLPPLFPRILRKSGLDISLAAFLATYPVLLYHFQSVSWTGIFANLFAVPAFALILPLAFAALIPLGDFLSFPARILLSGSYRLLEIIAIPVWGTAVCAQPPLGLLLAYYFCGGMLAWLIHRRAPSP